MNVDARWATQQLEEHIAKRRGLGLEQRVPPPRTRWDRDEDAPPPALTVSVDPDDAPTSSPDARASTGAYSAAPTRWASRFRDGLPPPPPPLPPITGRDMIAAMTSLGIDPTDAKAQIRLESLIADGALTDYDDDLYVFIRAQQRASQKRRLKRAALIPQHVLDGQPPPPSQQTTRAPGQSRPALNDRSGGGPMQPENGPFSHVSDQRTDHRPTPGDLPPAIGSRRGTPTQAAGHSPSVPPPQQSRPLASTPVYGSLPPAAPATSSRWTDQDALLSQSQKRRLRRKKQKQGVGMPTLPQTRDSRVPFDLVNPAPEYSTNGVSPTDPAQPWSDPETDVCSAEVMIAVEDPRGGDPIPLWFTCPLRPYPHPNQPHLIQIPFDNTGGTEVFLGWFDPPTDPPTTSEDRQS